MNRKIIFAGAASALLLGTVAIAQTTPDTSSTARGSDGSMSSAPAGSSGQGASVSGQSAVSDQGAAMSADQAGTDSATTADTMAGERG